MRNTDLGMFFYCAQLAIRQFSRYMQTASTQLLTGSWRMKIDTLWFEKQSVGSAARIESMSFRACDLLQCLIFVMTIPRNFCWIALERKHQESIARSNTFQIFTFHFSPSSLSFVPLLLLSSIYNESYSRELFFKIRKTAHNFIWLLTIDLI